MRKRLHSPVHPFTQSFPQPSASSGEAMLIKMSWRFGGPEREQGNSSTCLPFKRLDSIPSTTYWLPSTVNGPLSTEPGALPKCHWVWLNLLLPLPAPTRRNGASTLESLEGFWGSHCAQGREDMVRLEGWLPTEGEQGTKSF